MTARALPPAVTAEVERILDAAVRRLLAARLDGAISGLVDEHAWAVEQAYEEVERAILKRMASTA